MADEKNDEAPGEVYTIDSAGAKVGVGDTVMIACRVAGVHGDRISVVSNLEFEEDGDVHHETFYVHAKVATMTKSTDG